jgi:ribosomal protein S18 acetylase RimI-like enzyme
MELRIKRLESQDVHIAIKVVKSFAAKDASFQHMQRFLSNPTNYLIVAQANDNVVGFLLAYALDRLKEDSHKMFIYEIEVTESHRRKGIGAALISYVRGIVKQEKLVSPFAFTSYSNEGAVEFYKSDEGEIENGDDLLFVYVG